MSTCPAGHQSKADDYCDTCGLPIDKSGTGGPAASAKAADAPPAAATKCPHCDAATPPDALFCEACGYDFTTGATPQPIVRPGADKPDEPTGDKPGPDASKGAPDGPDPIAPSNPSPPLAEAYVAEVWIDADWYADQQSDDPLPSPGTPTIVKLTHSSVLIGRTSRSRSITPEIDLANDTGISRRHAQLTTDGKRWFVEDLGSSNGTYVGKAGPLPSTPIDPGKKVEVPDGARIYLGAWTRIVVRKAGPGE